MDEMEICSLEEDENQIVFTQTGACNKGAGRNIGIIGNENDFTSPCSSVLDVKQLQYSDISDDDFEIPSSQIPKDDR